MSTYAIVKVVNGSFAIAAEGIKDLTNAITQFHGICQTLWNAPDVKTGSVKLIDETQKQYAWYYDEIKKEQA